MSGTPAAPVPSGPGQRSRLAAVYGGSAAQHRSLLASPFARWFAAVVHLPRLPGAALDHYDGLVIPERLHHGLLEAAGPTVRRLLDHGGLVVAFSGGDPLPSWLPGVTWQHRPTNFWWWRQPGAPPPVVAADPGHDLWAQLCLADATWHIHGVLRPAPGVDTVLATPAGEPVLTVDRVSTPGTIVAACLDPLSHYGAYFMPACERFLAGFLPWAAAEAERLRRGRPRTPPGTTRLPPGDPPPGGPAPESAPG